MATITGEAKSLKKTNIIFGSETIDISSTDHTFTKPVRTIIVTATGDVSVQLEDETDQVYPCYVPTGGHFRLVGSFLKVYKATTTATVTFGET
jgi:hypothetical protein